MDLMNQKQLENGGTNPAGKLWSDIMKAIHKNLPGKKFIKPESVVSSTVCRDSGMKTTELCALDPRGARAITDIFMKGTLPTDACDLHVKIEVCEDTGLLPTEFCPKKIEVVKLSDKYKWSENNAEYIVPVNTCTAHTSLNDLKSHNANLSKVNLGTGYTIAPKFLKDTLGYVIIVPNEVINAVITFEAEDKKATLKTAGSLNNLEVGVTVTYTVTVTAEDGTTKKTYTFSIKRAAAVEPPDPPDPPDPNTITNTTP